MSEWFDLYRACVAHQQGAQPRRDTTAVLLGGAFYDGPTLHWPSECCLRGLPTVAEQSVAPNLVVWTGARHCLALSLKDG